LKYVSDFYLKFIAIFVGLHLLWDFRTPKTIGAVILLIILALTVSHAIRVIRKQRKALKAGQPQ
jgi:hypothetical protein